MKKNYIAPAIEELNMMATAMVAASEDVYNQKDSENEQLGKGRRNDWDNIWQ